MSIKCLFMFLAVAVMARQQVAVAVALLLALLTSFRGNYCQLLPLERRAVRRLMERCYRRRAALMRLQLLLEQVGRAQHLQIYAGLKLQLVAVVELHLLQRLVVEVGLVAYMVTVEQEALLILHRRVQQAGEVVLVAMVEIM
jgi:hypothetical protein